MDADNQVDTRKMLMKVTSSFLLTIYSIISCYYVELFQSHCNSISLNSYQFHAKYLAVVFDTDTVTDRDQPFELCRNRIYKLAS